MLLSITEKEALELIRSPRIIHEECLVPADSPPCPNSPYRHGYDWLYRYERQIAAILEPWLKKQRYDLIGEKGILCEALSNAFFHGHGKDAQMCIQVSIYQGGHGLLVRIADSGKGFDIANVYRRYLHRRLYYTSAGNGIRLMVNSQSFGIFYSPSGSTFYLLYLFSGDLKTVGLRWAFKI